MEASDLIAEIMERRALFMAQNNARPGKLLLGREQWYALKEYAKLCDFKLREADGLARPEFNQMKIYPVDDDSYIGVNA